MQQQEPLVIEANKQKAKLPSKHKIRLINGQPVCISCESRHTVNLPKGEIDRSGEVVIDFS